jgi:DNA polymerase-3 subunit delta
VNLKPQQLAATLAKNLAPIYVVAGEEPLLMQEALDAIRAAARTRGYAEREILDAEKGFDWQRLVDACNAMSLFASLRIVELRLGGAADVAGGKILAELAKRPPQDVLLIVSAGKLDWRARQGGWFAALEAAGVAVYAEPLKPAELPGWIDARLHAEGLSADPDALHLLAERTEGNLLAAQQEVQKLGLLKPGAKLSASDIDEAVADSAHFEVFGWINRVMAGDARGAVRGLNGLRGEGVDIIPILSAFSAGLRQLAAAAAAYARSRNAAAAVEAARIMRMNQPAYTRAVERTRPAQVLGWLRQCARIDQLAKSTGGQPAAWEELLTLVLAATGAAPARRTAVRA